MSKLEVHPVADLFPMLADDELKELAEDIKARGLLQPIVLDVEGRVLDGRNRLAACELAGIEPRFETYEGDDPNGYALAVNVARRHLKPGQRAVVVERARRLIDGQQWKFTKSQMSIDGAPSISRLAEAAVVLDFAPDLGDAVLAGAMSLDTAAKAARERKRVAAEIKAKKERLVKAAPDLADQVDDGRLDLDEALGALTVREERARQEVLDAQRKADEEQRRIAAEAGPRATVERIDAIRDADGGSVPSFADRVADGSMNWQQAGKAAEQWLAERNESLERERNRIRSVISGWPTMRNTILPDPEGKQAKEIIAGLGESDQEALAKILAEIAE